MKKDYLSRLNFNQILTNVAAVLAVVCLSAVSLQAQSNARVIVTAPAGSEVEMGALQSAFGTGFTAGEVSGPVIGVDDGTGNLEGCNPLVNDLTGAIALVDRGTCGFVVKAQTAQAAGAIGVIVCNTELRDNVPQPYKYVTMGGDDMGTVTIPTVMISWQNCETLKADLANGLEVTLSPDGLPLEPAQGCETAIAVSAGTHSVDPIIEGLGGLNIAGPSALITANHAAYYSYTAPANALVTVTNCGFDVDSRLAILQSEDCASFSVLAFNDDCDPDNAVFSSEVSFVAVAGQTYYIYWDDYWDYNGFDFTISEGALPEVAGTFSVNMANETVSGDGVSMVYAGPGATGLGDVTIVPLADDDGDGIWSGTATLTALDTIGYAFVNGDVLAGGTIEAVPAQCGIDGGFGFNVRPLIVTSAEDFAVPVVCFSTCSAICPEPGDCSLPPVVFENLDEYTLGFVGPQSDVWTTWSGAGGEGTAEDAFVSDAQAHSAPNSILIEGQNGPTDLVLDLGQRSEGNWYLAFWMYVPSGRYAYYNIQDDLPFNATQWNLEVDFNANSDGQIIESGATVANFSFPHDTWFQVVHRIDLDNDNAALIVDGVNVWNWEYGPDFNIGSFDFYPNANGPNQWYLDDIVLRPLDPCPEGAIICDGFEAYTEGPVSDQSADWAPWTSSPADDGVVQADPGFARSGCQSLVIDDGDPDDQLLLLGDRTSGNYLLEWYMYVPTGRLGYYNLQKFQDNPGATGGFALQLEWFADGTVTVDAGAADVVTFNWTPDTWMHVQHFIDLDNNWISLVVDDAVIYEWPANWQTFATTGAKQIGSVDFFGNTGVTYYLDDVLFQQLPSLPGNLCGGSISIQNLLGQGVGTTVSSGSYDNTNYSSTSQDPDFGWECFGEPDGAGSAPSLERTVWFSFVGDGNQYFIEALGCGDDPIDFDDTQMAVYSGNCGNLAAVDCSEDGENAMSGFFPASLHLQTEQGVTYYVMVDGFGPDFPADGQFCLEVTQETQVQVTVTFQVDAFLLNQAGTMSPEGMFLAGSWDGFASNTAMDDTDGDGIWVAELALDPNTAYQYKFKNGPDGWESIVGDCTVGGFGDRQVDVGGDDLTLDVVCFGYCVACVDNVDETTLANSVRVFPNPARELLNVRVDLPEAADNLTIRMINAFGQVVSTRYLGALQTGNIEIDVTNMPAGAYMIQVMDGKAQFTQSVIVE